MSIPPMIDPSGRIQWHDGVRYYSPNSEVDVPLKLEPEFDKRTLQTNPFKPGAQGRLRVRYRDFVHPRAWSRNFAWLSFIPVIPTQWYCDRRSYFGQILCQHPPINRFMDENGRPSGFQVATDNTWVQLESNLYSAVVALSGHYHVPCTLPFLPAAIGYRDMYSRKQLLKRILDQSREWFLVWFGALSYLVATLRNPGPWVDGLKQQEDYQWCTVLRDRGLPPSFVDELQHSLVVACDGVRRAGIVLIGHIYESNTQPSPGWFKEHGVAVWYRWGDEEQELAEQNYWMRILGPSHALMAQHPQPRDKFSTTDDVAVLQTDGGQTVSTAYPDSGVHKAPIQPSLTSPVPSTATTPNTLSFVRSTYTQLSPIPIPSTSESTIPLAGYQAQSPKTAIPVAPSSEVTQRLSESINDPSLASSNPNPPVSDQEGPVPSRKPEWIAFFEEREERHRAIMRTESSSDRQRRENRTREPATAGAKVFEWYPSEASGALYARFPVLAKARIDVLQAYGEAQKRYDPFFNEWDCCDEWGPDDEDEDDARFESPGSHIVDTAPICAATASSFVQIDKSTLPSDVSYTEADLPTDAFQREETANGDTLVLEIDENFGYFYGFHYPPPGGVVHPSKPKYTDNDIAFFLRVLGLEPKAIAQFGDRHGCPHFQAAHEYLVALCGRRDHPPGLWDLRDDCVHPVRLSSRFRSIRVVHLDDKRKVDKHDQVRRYYVFHDVEQGVAWKFAVTSASDALLACRLSKDATAYELAAFFVQHGVPFRTFHPANMLPRPPSGALTLVHRIPQRPFNHKFTKEDYDAYVEMRTLILGQSHMQAALKRGGIIWRLAVGILGISRVTLAPSRWGASHQIEIGGITLVDDVLTTTELDLICGAYECISDDGKQRSLKSWWPLATYYEKPECGENYGRWTPRRESWYAQRLQAIEFGGDATQQPLTYTEWKSTQHGPRSVRTLHAYIEGQSSELVTAHATHTPAPPH